MVHKRKKDLPNMSNRHQKRKRVHKQTKLEDAPMVHSIKDLIEIGQTFKLYQNLNIFTLWRILEPLQELNKLVGMESLKESMFYQIIYYLQDMHRLTNEEYLHTVIYGAPGTGKTTVAKIIARIYQGLNILSDKGPFRVVHRDAFIAGYLGQTANKTKKVLESCLGGVLFIDEVYALAPRQNDRDSFAKEAIDTINAFLSEHKNDFCCIIAGYENEVNNCFFNMNDGLERRFPWIHRIELYTPSELAKIFFKMVFDMQWFHNIEETELINLFNREKLLFKNGAGDVETFLTKCKIMHSYRVFSLAKEYKFVLLIEDINSAIEYIKKNGKREDSPPPFGMYL
jgi:replication-associated recombination protein RarA